MGETTLPRKIFNAFLILVFITIIVIAILTLLGPTTNPGIQSNIIMSI